MSSSIVWDLIAHDKVTGTFDKVGDSVDKTGGKFSKMKALAVAGLAAAGAAAVKFASDSVGAYIEAEESQNRLSDAYKKFPALADVSIEKLRDYNSELAKKTKFDDDAFASGQAVLAQFGFTGKELKDITPLMADFAAKTGRDLPTAAKDLGKAFLGNTRALKDLGIDYKMTGDKAKDMANIQRLVNEKVGGFAEREGKTAAGQAAILKNQFGEVQENVGAKLVPVLMKLAGVLLEVVTWMGENQTATKIILGTMGALAVVIGTITVATKVWTAVQTAFNVVMSANPIGLVIIAVAALAAGIVIAWKNSETFREVVKGAFDKVKDAGVWMKDKLIGALDAIKTGWDNLKNKVVEIKEKLLGILDTIFDPIKTAWTTVRDWISDKWEAWKDGNRRLRDSLVGILDDIFKPIRTAWTSVRDWVGEKWSNFKEWIGGLSLNFGGLFDGIKEAFRSSVNTVIGWWNGLSFGIPGFDPPGPGPKFGGITIGTPNIPMLADGGIVFGPTLAMIGEAGPEAVVPLDRYGGGGGDVTATVNLVLDGQVIHTALLRVKRDKGGVSLELD